MEILGGKNHFAADRAVAEQVLANMPTAITVARENRKFLGRAVRHLIAEAGVRQFLGTATCEQRHRARQRPEATVLKMLRHGVPGGPRSFLGTTNNG